MILCSGAPALARSETPAGSKPAAYSYPGSDSMAIGDFNGDGKPDLAFAGLDFGAGSVTIFLNNGDGTFTPGGSFPTGLTFDAQSDAGGCPDVAGTFRGGKVQDLFVTTIPDCSNPVCTPIFPTCRAEEMELLLPASCSHSAFRLLLWQPEISITTENVTSNSCSKLSSVVL